jgi:energy-coupling factor transporter ATP-binding protein EcfA2
MSDLFLLVGPNGCGKSRALQLLADRGRADSAVLGKALFPDLSIGTTSLLPQGSQRSIFSTSVRSLLVGPLVYSGLTIEESEAKVTALLRRFSFSRLLDRDYFTLSGGEKQFVSLFSALLWDVKTYLLDDPLAMLDRERACEALTVLIEFNQVAAMKQMVVGTTDLCLYSELTHGSAVPGSQIVHLGYAPDQESCVRQLDSLLRESDGSQGKGPVEVRLESLTVAPFGRCLLNKQEVALTSGQLLIVTGKNGEGKSCLLQVLAGLRSAQHGGISISAGRTTSRPSPGVTTLYLPQESSGLLGFGTVHEELTGSSAPKWWRKLLEFFYDWRVLEPNDRATEGSFGEMRFRATLAILGAVARKRDQIVMLLLDEPDAGLDHLRSSLLARLVGWLAKDDLLVVIVTHHPNKYQTGIRRVEELTLADQQLQFRVVLEHAERGKDEIAFC